MPILAICGLIGYVHHGLQVGPVSPCLDDACFDTCCGTPGETVGFRSRVGIALFFKQFMQFEVSETNYLTSCILTDVAIPTRPVASRSAQKPLFEPVFCRCLNRE